MRTSIARGLRRRAATRFAAAAGACLTLAACGAGGGPAETSEAPAAGASEVVAQVSGRDITAAELDAWIKERLFEEKASGAAALYDLRKEQLDDMLGERLLELAAEERGLTPERVVEEEIAALGPVTDAEVQAFYDESKERLGSPPLAEVEERIRDFLAARRERDALASLREKAEITIGLTPPRFEVTASGAARGPDDAPITIVEFSDFQCPFCRRVMPTIEQVMEKYPDQVRLVYRHLPLRNHPRARPAAEAAMCALDQDRFWPYHDKLFANTRALGDEDLLRYAEEVGLDTARFEQCFAERRFSDAIERDVQEAREIGVSGTPAFFVNGVMLSGARPAEQFFELIDAELERLGRQPEAS